MDEGGDARAAAARAESAERRRAIRHAFDEQRTKDKGLILDVPELADEYVHELIYEVTVGHAQGQIPLRGLEKYIRKLPRNIDRKTMESLQSIWEQDLH